MQEMYCWLLCKSNHVFFFAGTLLLESKIQTDTAYQKQQDTLIVWSERDNYDLALSFQEKAGCDEIWEKICQVSTSYLIVIYYVRLHCYLFT